MPVLFLGHGNPMYAIESNVYSDAWEKLGKSLPKPKAILAISAHWLTEGTSVTAMEHPETIHDFGGFPQKLFDVQYPAPGSEELAKRVKTLIKSREVELYFATFDECFNSFCQLFTSRCRVLNIKKFLRKTTKIMNGFRMLHRSYRSSLG